MPSCRGSVTGGLASVEPSGRARGVPGLQPVIDVERAFAQSNVLVQPVEVDGGRQLPMLQREDQLDEPSDSGGGEAVTYVALHRTQGAEIALLGIFLERLLQPFDFDRIAQLRAGAVRLDQLDVVRVDLVSIVDLLLQPGL